MTGCKPSPRRLWAQLAVTALLGAWVPACPTAEGFACMTDSECGEGGRCEPTQSCSFSDVTCGTGRRYGELAAPELANRCVGDPLVGGSGDTQAEPTTGTSADPGDADSGATTSAGDVAESSGSDGTVEPGCGNGIIDPGESCDGDNLGEQPTCADHNGYPEDQPVDCLDCAYRLTPCMALCGDGTINDVWEQCDPEARPDPLNGRTCADLDGFLGGALGCDPTACQYDTSACIPT
ncbi:MAG: hypothetical protein AAF721_40235 [Myxococcota bacterium]